MRIKEITVKKLFGVFDHTIPLNLDERITILYGLNGVGKTAILRLINDVFSGSFRHIMNYPFEELRIVGEDGSYVVVQSRPESIHRKDKAVTFQTFTLTYFNADNGNTEIFQPSKNLLQQIGGNQIESDQSPAVIISRYVNEQQPSLTSSVYYGDELENMRRDNSLLRKELPKWYLDLRSESPALLVETQRLLSIGSLLYFGSSTSLRNSRRSVTTVNNYARQLAMLIETTTARAQQLSQRLDSTFPTRLITGEQHTTMNEEELRRRLKALEEQRSAFIAVGLLDAGNVTMPPISESLDPSTRAALSVYVEDAAQKLDIYQELYRKIATFTSILNKRFNYKRMVTRRNSGLVFLTDQDQEIAPEALSSGEQHELVLFFELLFETKPGTLVLIDEPELSLHVVWEHEFLRDIQDVIRVVPLDVLIATHSPQIIADRWEWTVELKGPAHASVSNGG